MHEAVRKDFLCWNDAGSGYFYGLLPGYGRRAVNIDGLAMRIYNDVCTAIAEVVNCPHATETQLYNLLIDGGWGDCDRWIGCTKLYGSTFREDKRGHIRDMQEAPPNERLTYVLIMAVKRACRSHITRSRFRYGVYAPTDVECEYYASSYAYGKPSDYDSLEFFVEATVAHYYETFGLVMATLVNSRLVALQEKLA